MKEDVIENFSKKYVHMTKKGIILSGLAAIATEAYFEYATASGTQFRPETEQLITYGPAALIAGAGMIAGGIGGAFTGAVIGADITERGQSRVANAIYSACIAGTAIGFAGGGAGAVLGGICTVVGRALGRAVWYVST